MTLELFQQPAPLTLIAGRPDPSRSIRLTNPIGGILLYSVIRHYAICVAKP
jgi:hypothetical protein